MISHVSSGGFFLGTIRNLWQLMEPLIVVNAMGSFTSKLYENKGENRTNSHNESTKSKLCDTLGFLEYQIEIKWRELFQIEIITSHYLEGV